MAFLCLNMIHVLDLSEHIHTTNLFYLEMFDSFTKNRNN